MNLHDRLDRLRPYAHKDFDKCRLSNPCITKREAIDLATYIVDLEAEHERNQKKLEMLDEILEIATYKGIVREFDLDDINAIIIRACALMEAGK